MNTPTLTDDQYPTPATLVSAAILRSIGLEDDNLVDLDVSHVNSGPVRDALMQACEKWDSSGTFHGPREHWRIHLTVRPASEIQRERVALPTRKAPLVKVATCLTPTDLAAIQCVMARTGLSQSAAVAWAVGEGLRAAELWGGVARD